MNENESTTTQPGLIGRLLGRPASSTPAGDIRQAITELEARRKAIDTRLAEIQRASPVNGGPGPERRSVLQTGTPDQLVELDREVERLTAERDQQLPHQRAELDKRLEKAEAEEAKKRLPARIKALPGVTEEYSAAESAYLKAKAALDDAVSGIGVDRRTAGDDSPTVPAETVERIARIRGWLEDPRPGRFNMNRSRLFQQLTGETTPKARGDDSEPEAQDAGQQEPQRRQPEDSIWNRREPGAAG